MTVHAQALLILQIHSNAAASPRAGSSLMFAQPAEIISCRRQNVIVQQYSIKGSCALSHACCLSQRTWLPSPWLLPFKLLGSQQVINVFYTGWQRRFCRSLYWEYLSHEADMRFKKLTRVVFSCLSKLIAFNTEMLKNTKKIILNSIIQR